MALPAFKMTDPVLGLPALDDVSSTARVPVGTRCQGIDGTYGPGEFIYLKGVASTAVGSLVTFYPDDYTTALLVANAIGQVAVAMAATVANTYGWYQIYGKGACKVVAAVADNGLVYACATAGSGDDAATAGDRVKNAIFASATDGPATGYAEIELYYPLMDDGSSA